MKKFHGVWYERQKLIHISVPENQRYAVRNALLKCPFVDSVDVRPKTNVYVFLSALATKEDVKKIEPICRDIVGPDCEEAIFDRRLATG